MRVKEASQLDGRNILLCFMGSPSDDLGGSGGDGRSRPAATAFLLHQKGASLAAVARRRQDQPVRHNSPRLITASVSETGGVGTPVERGSGVFPEAFQKFSAAQQRIDAMQQKTGVVMFSKMEFTKHIY
jgi:hypothetical protein